MTDDFETVRRATDWCPVHHRRDCSPLLNGCSMVNNNIAALDRIESRLHAAEEVVEAAKRMGADYLGPWYANPDDPRTQWTDSNWRDLVWRDLARSLARYDAAAAIERAGTPR